MNVKRFGCYMLIVGVVILAVLGLGALIFALGCAVAWTYSHHGILVGTFLVVVIGAFVLFFTGLLVMLWAEK